MTNLSRLTWRAFYAPKAGHTLDEYEDAFAGDPEKGRFAVADGASESAFADAWAQILVNAYVQKKPGPRSGWLAAARERWCAQIQTRELPWYGEAKFAEGAYAALLGVTFKGLRWRVTSVGDCCLFQVRADALVRAVPIEHSREFGNRPTLVGSRARQTDQPPVRSVKLQGRLQAGDRIFLLTDALAEWFLKSHEAGRQPWIDLQAIAAAEPFARLMQKLRETKELRNDDATLMVIEPQNP